MIIIIKMEVIYTEEEMQMNIDNYDAWFARREEVYKLQAEVTRAYLTYLDADKLCKTYKGRFPQGQDAEKAVSVLYLVFSDYEKEYISACNDLNKFRQDMNVWDSKDIVPFDFFSIRV